jgi:C-terminal processing protease CtpA/Prc
MFVRFPRQRIGAAILLAALLPACGGEGSSPPPPIVSPTPIPTPTPPPVAVCSLRSRQDWAEAAIREHYLFPETLPISLDPAAYASVDAYIDALTATARAQGKDRFFTYLTSIAEEDAFNASGATAAFGIRLQTDTAAQRVLIADAYEGAPALAAGIDRGAEILAIGTSAETLVPVATLIARGGSALTDAFGPSDAGVTRAFRVSDTAGTRVVTITKADFSLPPVSPRFGSSIIATESGPVGYINLRTFISSAEAPLRAAFAGFRDQGITRVIVDFRYNSGGLLSQAFVVADLLGQNRQTSDVLNFITFRPSKAASNQTRLFQPQPQAIAPMRIAFVTTGTSASASELVINAFLPYLRADAILVGANTFGKPVGQIAVDRRECDDRLRIVAFATQNAARQGDYFNGLAGTVEASCAAGDGLARQMGDPAETSTRAAIDALAGRTCTPIAVELRAQSLADAAPRDPLLPLRPSAAQRELPGTF